MQYVVCYDIADDRRRERLSSALLDYGARVQESVFVANLDDELAAGMMGRIRKLVDESFDRVHVFSLCGACSGRTVMVATAEMPVEREFYVI